MLARTSLAVIKFLVYIWILFYMYIGAPPLSLTLPGIVNPESALSVPGTRMSGELKLVIICLAVYLLLYTSKSVFQIANQ